MRNWLKRLLPLAAALCLLLGACGEKAAGAYDPAAAAKALLDSEAFADALEEVDKETAAVYYGLDESAIEDCAVYTSLSAGAEEIAVLTFSGEEAAKAAVTALQGHLEDQKAVLKDYKPDDVSKLDGAILDRRGNSVLLTVAADKDAAQAVLDGLDET